MAAPDYVPKPADDRPRVYSSPPWRPEPWMADRPAELGGPQPSGPRLGAPGPDQGYAMRLARRFEDDLVLGPGEHAEDALSGCLAIAMRRSSLFGRAPVVHDLAVALDLWGFRGEVPADLQEARRSVFAGVANVHHYAERRAIADAVPEEVLRLTPAEVATSVRSDPRRALAFARAIRAGSAVVAD